MVVQRLDRKAAACFDGGFALPKVDATMSSETLQTVIGYHQQTKHHPNRYARSLGYLDWATQPDPFRRFDGAEQVPLDHPPLFPEPTYDELFTGPAARDEALDRQAISRLFYDSLALSAWKQAPGSGRWSLRVNPSSGALHPTEGYLVAGAIEGIGDRPAVYHYSPMTHALERRVTLGGEHWDRLSSQLPTGTVLVALTSIYWRESWKYGERAFRYCHHDVGHAIGAVTVAAATLGCQTRQVTSVDDDQLAALLGADRQQGIEAEHPDCLLAVFPGSPSSRTPWPTVDMPSNLLQHLASCDFAGAPNRLSSNHQPWPVIDQVAEATRASASSITAYQPHPWPEMQFFFCGYSSTEKPCTFPKGQKIVCRSIPARPDRPKIKAALERQIKYQYEAEPGPRHIRSI